MTEFFIFSPAGTLIIQCVARLNPHILLVKEPADRACGLWQTSELKALLPQPGEELLQGRLRAAVLLEGIRDPPISREMSVPAAALAILPNAALGRQVRLRGLLADVMAPGRPG